MTRLRRPCATWIPLTLMLGAASGCISLRYDEPAPGSQAHAASDVTAEPAWPAMAEAGEAAASDGASAATGPRADAQADAESAPPDTPARRATPMRARLEAQRSGADDATSGGPPSWRTLTRLAREHAQAGQLDQARALLEEAARSLADRRATSTRRRTVFGLRARLAQDFAAHGQPDAADQLADQLFEEARLEPELGDAALVSLAYSTAQRRREAARAAGRTDPQLPLLALAFDTAARGTASRERLGLAFEVSGIALRSGDLELARRAIDQAVLDARLIAPGDRVQAASLKVYKARIALAQRDFAAAESSAHAALQLFEEIGADPASRGVTEITLARVLGEQGERDRALELARTAYARLAETKPLPPHARRQIAAGLARVESLAGDPRTAEIHYREALVAPSDGSAIDDDLIRSVKDALAQLESGPPTTGAPGAPTEPAEPVAPTEAEAAETTPAS